ncbi:transposase [Streptomyces sp. NPDC015492]|uniref:transposase n=1 Tax=Streptomyces sp. NPDC015492 TaxID=3364958 RepID=UPI0036FA9A5D
MPGPPARRRSQEKGAPGRAEPEDHALGRSRGGLSTKVHLASDSRARPLALRITAGQAGDVPAFETVMAAIRVPRNGPGRPRIRPNTVLATARTHPARSEITSADAGSALSFPSRPTRSVGHRLRRGRAGGRPPAFDAEAYKQRNAVERCINRLKQWRGLAMRTDKLAIAYQAALAILIWAR